jgi:hypothetical protein
MRTVTVVLRRLRSIASPNKINERWSQLCPSCPSALWYFPNLEVTILKCEDLVPDEVVPDEVIWPGLL